MYTFVSSSDFDGLMLIMVLGNFVGGRWKEEEHHLFEKGLKKHGKGKWKKIAAEFVKTRTAAQVASHAQKVLQSHLQLQPH